MKISKFITKIDLMMEAAWLLLIFALPLVFFPNIFTTFELAKIVVFKAGAVLLTLLWLLKYLVTGKSPGFDWKNHRYLWILLAGFLGWYLLTTIVSVAPALSFLGWYPRFQGLTALMSYVIFGMVIFFELQTPQQKERFQFVVMTSFFAACGIALLQKFLPGFLQWWNDAEFNGRIYGTLANPNYLAGFVVMIIPLVVSRIFRHKQTVFSIVCLVAGMMTLMFTLSRSGFLAVFLSLLFFFFIAAYRKRAKKTLLALAILPVIAGGFIWYVIAHEDESWVKHIPLFDRLTTSEENMSSTRTRLEIWPATVRQILASPLIGFGPETYAVTFPAFAPPTVNSREDSGEIADHAHNELLDLAVQTGIPGMLAYLGFIAGMIFAGTRKFLTAEKNDPDAFLVLGLCSGVLALFIANEFGFSVTVHWVLLAAFSGLLLNTFHHGDFTAVPYRLGKFWKTGLFSLVSVLSIGMFWLHDVRMVEADDHMRKAYDAIIANNLGATGGPAVSLAPELVSQISGEFEKAVRFAPSEAFYSLNLAHFELGRLYDGQKLSSVEIMAALGHALHAARLRGYDGFSVSIAQEIKKISGLTF